MEFVKNCLLYEINNDEELIKLQIFYYRKGYNWKIPLDDYILFSDIKKKSDIIYIHINNDEKLISYTEKIIPDLKILNIKKIIRDEKINKISNEK